MRIGVLVTVAIGMVFVTRTSAEPAKQSDPVTRAADRVAGAIVSSSTTEIEAVARAREPDPWIVAEELLHRGNVEAANALATLVQGPDGVRLPGYVDARAQQGTPQEARAALVAYRVASAKRDRAAALQAVASFSEDVECVTVARALALRGVMLNAHRRPAEGVTAALAAMTMASRLGWIRLEMEAMQLAARCCWEDQDQHRALELLEASVPLVEKRRDPKATLHTAMNLGMLHNGMGQFGPAILHLERAQALAGTAAPQPIQLKILTMLAQAERSAGLLERAWRTTDRMLQLLASVPASLPKALALIEIGIHAAEDGEIDAAIQRFAEAREVLDAQPHEQTLFNLDSYEANLARRSGRIDEAHAAYMRLRALAETRGNHLAVATLDIEIARCLVTKASFSEAAAVALRARETAASVAAGLLEVRASATQARALLEQDRVAEALSVYQDSIRRLQRVEQGFASHEGASAREVHGHMYRYAALAAMRANDSDALFSILEASRAQTLLEALGGREMLSRHVLPKALRQLDKATRDRVSAAARSVRALPRDASTSAKRDARVALGEAQRARTIAVERIEREAKYASALPYPAMTTLHATQSQMKADEVLILLGETPAAVVALVVRAKEARIVTLKLSEATTSLRDEIADALTERELEVRLARARSELIEPLGLGARDTYAHIVPFGELALVPYAALMPNRRIALRPSCSTESLLGEIAPVTSSDVLALGDPMYEGTPKGLGVLLRGGKALPRLPGSGAEARTVGTTVRLRADANERALDELTRSRPWRAVHVACHGLVDDDRPLLSCLALSPSEGHDGLLTVHEILRLRLRTDLVVLSACDTGLGKVHRAEGVLGLTRACMHAGAPRVVSSLWKVDDDATAALMKAFYTAWRAAPDVSVGDALQSAQAHVRAQKKWAHPRFWAAWVLWGTR